MHLLNLKRIRKALPRGYRLKLVPRKESTKRFVDPDFHFFQKIVKGGFLRFPRKWETFGYIKQFSPANPPDVICLYQNGDLEKHLLLVEEIMNKLKFPYKIELV